MCVAVAPDLLEVCSHLNACHQCGCIQHDAKDHTLCCRMRVGGAASLVPHYALPVMMVRQGQQPTSPGGAGDSSATVGKSSDLNRTAQHMFSLMNPLNT